MLLEKTVSSVYCQPTDTPKEAKRKNLFNQKINFLISLQTQLGAQAKMACHCGHAHAPAQQSSTTDTPDNIDIESHTPPSLPSTINQEPEDWAIQIGKAGETITALGGILVTGPLLDKLFQAVFTHHQNQVTHSLWFHTNSTLASSPASLLMSVPIIVFAIIGAPYCHAQLEIASRLRENFLHLSAYTINLLTWGRDQKLQINNTQLTIPDITLSNNQRVKIDQFELINQSNILPMSNYQKLCLFGDLEQHFFEYVGLLILGAINHIKNPIAQYLTIFSILASATYACLPEWTTCKNTLLFINTFNQKKIVQNPAASNSANFATKFSAFAKTFALFYANFLSFEQMFFNNLPAALVLTTLVTLGNVITQYFINKNTQDIGEAKNNHPQLHHADSRTGWQKLSLFGKALVITRALGTGNERSEPITLLCIASFQWTNQPVAPATKAGLAFGLWALGILTSYSEARNAAEHTSRSIYFYNTADDQKNVTHNTVTTPLLGTSN